MTQLELSELQSQLLMSTDKTAVFFQYNSLLVNLIKVIL